MRGNHQPQRRSGIDPVTMAPLTHNALACFRRDASQKRDAAARRHGCHECGHPKVLRQVGPRYYCGGHTAEAFLDAKQTLEVRR